MAEQGRVIEIKGDLAIVSMMRNEACSRCNACKKGDSENELIIKALNECNAEKDDLVNIELRDNDFLRAVLIAYGLPLLMFFIGAGTSYFIATLLSLESLRELIAFLFGIFFILVSYFFIKLHEKRWKSNVFVPIAIEVTIKAE